MGKYITAIQIHEKLDWLQTQNPRLISFLDRTNSPTLKEKSNDVPLRLAHCNLHLGNIMIDPMMNSNYWNFGVGVCASFVMAALESRWKFPAVGKSK